MLPYIKFVSGLVLAIGLLVQMPLAYAQSPNKKGKTAWIVKCKSGLSGKSNCKTFQQVRVKKTKKVLLQVTISKPDPKKSRHAMLLRLPTGLFLPAGAAIQVDEYKALTAVIQTCDVRGCFAGVPVSEELLQRMKQGKKLTVAFQNLKKQTVAIGLTLKGITRALKRL